MKDSKHHQFNSVSELHSQLNLKKPTHPLVSVVNLDDINSESDAYVKTIMYNFYTVF